MAEHSLSGVTVLVTRPQGLGEDLVQAIESRGGRAVLLPAIAIQPVQPDTSELAELATLPAGGLAIFASRNAVAWGARYLPQPRPRVAAIGPSTASALAELGMTPDIRPAGYTTEDLLAQPEFADLAGVRVFIIRGANGRETLSAGLKARGARVRYLDVYRRVPPPLDPQRREEILARWAAGGIHIYTATSGDMFSATSDAILGPEGEPLLQEYPAGDREQACVTILRKQSGHPLRACSRMDPTTGASRRRSRAGMRAGAARGAKG
jgi:uroporphyrinogen-III synthase